MVQGLAKDAVVQGLAKDAVPLAVVEVLGLVVVEVEEEEVEVEVVVGRALGSCAFEVAVSPPLEGLASQLPAHKSGRQAYSSVGKHLRERSLPCISCARSHVAIHGVADHNGQGRAEQLLVALGLRD